MSQADALMAAKYAHQFAGRGGAPAATPYAPATQHASAFFPPPPPPPQHDDRANYSAMASSHAHLYGGGALPFAVAEPGTHATVAALRSELHEKDLLLAKALAEVRGLTQRLEFERAQRRRDVLAAKHEAFAEFTTALRRGGPAAVEGLQPAPPGASDGAWGPAPGVDPAARLPLPSLRHSELVRTEMSARLRSALAGSH